MQTLPDLEMQVPMTHRRPPHTHYTRNSMFVHLCCNTLRQLPTQTPMTCALRPRVQQTHEILMGDFRSDGQVPQGSQYVFPPFQNRKQHQRS
mmetsp:Transcript_17818/g.26168  ORF Transcript_17818/g.26168 Transcript_17818/m.26168 type:complete len:92 (-) Transcript_17818:503-778(-)